MFDYSSVNIIPLAYACLYGLGFLILTISSLCLYFKEWRIENENAKYSTPRIRVVK